MDIQPIPEYLWQLISQDIGILECTNYLINIDNHTEFIKADELDSTLPNATAVKTGTHLAHSGVPAVICRAAERILMCRSKTNLGAPPTPVQGVGGAPK